MTYTKALLAVILLFLISHTTVEACQRVDSPCPGGQCCHLVFNFKLLSFSFCRRRNKNDDKCAQDDYCLLDSDCDSGGSCVGASTTKWGRCQGGLNPCDDSLKTK